ncbi:DUF6294 family protein [Nonomuraea sp. H19]|uniref:DUF6294 family protein n=1 Tax=Nonomuraea sp. H19 TaxID=3452206 RepID=UPI003F88DBCD
MKPTEKRTTRKIGKMASVTAATAAVIMGLSLATAGTAQAQTPKVFTWKYDMRTGDCTMFAGAKWTLYPDGTAEFVATVTSGANNDAWLMWARLMNSNGAVMGALANADIQDPTDRAKFVKNLPSRRYQYEWTASGEFNYRKFSSIKRISLSKHC